MSAIQKLIDETLSYAVEAAQESDTDMAKLYMEDWKEFNDISYFISAGYTRAAGERIEVMDTLPREQFVVAVQKDYGDQMISKLGFELA